MKMPVFQTHLKIFNSRFLFIQQVTKIRDLNSPYSQRKFVYEFITNNNLFSCKQKLLNCYIIPVLFALLPLGILYFPCYIEVPWILNKNGWTNGTYS